MRANAETEGAVGGNLFGEHCRGDAVKSRATIFFRHTTAKKPDLSSLLHQLGHHAFLVQLEFEDEWSDFLADEFLGSLADQTLVVGQFRGSEDLFRARRYKEEAASGRQDSGCCRRSHISSKRL